MQTVLLTALKYGFLIFCSVYSTIHLTNQRYTMTISRGLIRGGLQPCNLELYFAHGIMLHLFAFLLWFFPLH